MSRVKEHDDAMKDIYEAIDKDNAMDVEGILQENIDLVADLIEAREEIVRLEAFREETLRHIPKLGDGTITLTSALIEARERVKELVDDNIELMRQNMEVLQENTLLWQAIDDIKKAAAKV